MKTELIDVSPTRKELKIEIDAADVRAEFNRVSNRYLQLASVPGFRRGHAPINVVRQRYKKEIRSEVLQQIVPQAINDAITERELNVIGQPEVHFDKDSSLDQLGDQPISLHAHVEVFPDVTLGRYKGLEAARRTRPVTDEMVQEVINDLRENSASLIPVEDRGAEIGDTVTVNFSGRYIQPPSEEDINADEVEVVLGGEGVLQDFTDNLLGTRPDDVKTFTVKYPEDFSSKGLAGKEIEYTATVTAVRVKELPEIDDEWAKSVDEDIDSVQALRESIRKDLTEQAKFESDQRLRNDLVNKLVAEHQFEVPETLVQLQSQDLLRSMLRDMLYRGVDPRTQEINWDGLRETVREQAIKDLRASMLLERLAEEEKIEVTDEEVEAEISSIAESTRQPIEQVRATLTKQGGERSIADRLRNRKALDLLVENAEVREEEWREEEEPETATGPIAPATENQEAAQTSDVAANSSEETQANQEKV